MFSVGVIIMVVFFGKSIFPNNAGDTANSSSQYNMDELAQASQDPMQVPEDYIPPFTKEEFLQQDRFRARQYLSLWQRRELPKLMSEYMYIPGLPVTLYETKDLNESTSLNFPGDGVFYVENTHPYKESWVYQVLISEGGYQRTMFIAEENLGYADYYGSGPTQNVRKAYEEKQARMREAVLEKENAINEEYNTAVANYYALHYVEPKPTWSFSELKNFDLSQDRIVFGGIIGVFILFILVMVGSILIAWRRSRQLDSQTLTLDEIVEIEDDFAAEPEPDQKPKKPDYYSPFSERGADYYDAKEEETTNLAGKRF